MVKRVSSSEPRFEDYLERIAAVLGHEDRREPLRGYLVGLCLPGERKSIEPMAARVDPRHVRARHQSRTFPNALGVNEGDILTATGENDGDYHIQISC